MKGDYIYRAIDKEVAGISLKKGDLFSSFSEITLLHGISFWPAGFYTTYTL